MKKNGISKRHNVLNPQVELFCSLFTRMGTPTFNRREAAAIEAGYAPASAGNKATKLLRDPAVLSRIQELHQENLSRNNLTVDRVLADLEHDKILARNKGDIASAIRADELQGKFLSMFVDRFAVDPEERICMTEHERQEAKRIAAVLIDSPLPALPERAFAPQPVVASDHEASAQ